MFFYIIIFLCVEMCKSFAAILLGEKMFSDDKKKTYILVNLYYTQNLK